jgi:hypothetical protein
VAPGRMAVLGVGRIILEVLGHLMTHGLFKNSHFSAWHGLFPALGSLSFVHELVICKYVNPVTRISNENDRNSGHSC